MGLEMALDIFILLIAIAAEIISIWVWVDAGREDT